MTTCAGPISDSSRCSFATRRAAHVLRLVYGPRVRWGRRSRVSAATSSGPHSSMKWTNVTLNSPAEFHWGFKQDGPANCIYSETMAQILQHATAYELVNNPQQYGIGEDLAFDVAQSAKASMCIVRRSYENYRTSGCAIPLLERRQYRRGRHL